MVFINSKALPLAAGIFFSASSAAEVALYGQCGGTGFTGSTSCASGAVCQSQNAFYYQCVEGTATASSAVASSSAIAPVTTALPSSNSTIPVSSTISKEKGSSTTFATSKKTSHSAPVSTQISSEQPVATSIQNICGCFKQYILLQCNSEPLTQAAVATGNPSIATSASTSRSATSSGTKYLMVFGDSYSSNGWYGGANTPSAENPTCSLVLGFDYAEYGATTDKSLVRGATHDLVAQVNEFQTYTAHNASTIAWTEDNTMAVVWLGINDVGNSFWDGFVTPFDKILDQYFHQLQILKHLQYYESFYTALKNPAAHNATDSTCANSDGTTCLWYDNYHPGQAIQKLVAQNFVKALTGTFF
ncbi:hypothetical protein DID88_001817 [Monilinia fructigena]|uniref:CBM1 domain-containing protein n=1 Tax=Monilinia fructigena TaxID=38457 RepID=A0A395IW11_9HELO|nr:hypothetical protein DID88_001817 [Monilinia fructigena]